ncbi:MAG: hypothetical protein ACTTH7_05015, partial [Treponema sp.]
MIGSVITGSLNEIAPDSGTESVTIPKLAVNIFERSVYGGETGKRAASVLTVVPAAPSAAPDSGYVFCTDDFGINDFGTDDFGIDIGIDELGTDVFGGGNGESVFCAAG